MEIKCEHPNIIINPSLKMVLLSSLYFVLDGDSPDKSIVYVDDKLRRKLFTQTNYINKRFGRSCRDAFRVTADNLENSYCMTYNHEKVYIWMLVPCGKCELCRDKAIKEWKTRCWCESHPEGNVNTVSRPLFVTLTYCGADSVMNVLFKRPQKEVVYLCKRHVQLFLKRLRKWLSIYYPECKIRYYVCGEYGHNYHRPHYHMLIWGLPQKIATYVGNILSYKKDVYYHVDPVGSPDSLEKYHCGEYTINETTGELVYVTKFGKPIDESTIKSDFESMCKDFEEKSPSELRGYYLQKLVDSVDSCKYIFHDKYQTADGNKCFLVRDALKHLLQDCWSYGYVDLQNCKDLSGQYCMKYVKKTDSWLPEGCDEDQMPFYLASRGETKFGNSGGLGIDWLVANADRYKQDLDLNHIAGTIEVKNRRTLQMETKPCNMALPRYFKEKLFPSPSRIYSREFRETLDAFITLYNDLLFSPLRDDVRDVVQMVNDAYPLNLPVPNVGYRYHYRVEDKFNLMCAYADTLVNYYAFKDGEYLPEHSEIRALSTRATAKKRKLQAFARSRSQNCDCAGLSFNQKNRKDVRMREPKGLVDFQKVQFDSYNMQKSSIDPEIKSKDPFDLSYKICNYIQTFEFIPYERKPLPDFKRPYPSADTKCSQFLTL